mmetsp:Transcript_5940/g.10191  ORF Transcript_5940/g.10191 Transcript_5940/m.10191 type:complete len:249 (-) Transcript_5940:569-1315(-)
MYTKTPADHMSTGVPYLVPTTISGATVSGEPKRSVSPCPESCAAKPKSHSLKMLSSTLIPSCFRRMFSHLMSLCTTFCLCRYWRADKTWRVAMMACNSVKPRPVSFDWATMASKRSPPRQYSKMSVTVLGSSKNSKSSQMWSCFMVRCNFISPSSPKRYFMSRGCKRAFRTIFAAISLSSRITLEDFGVHLQTKPKVPSPKGPFPTKAYLSSNSDLSGCVSSGWMISSKRLEQLSSRTMPVSPAMLEL